MQSWLKFVFRDQWHVVQVCESDRTEVMDDDEEEEEEMKKKTAQGDEERNSSCYSNKAGIIPPHKHTFTIKRMHDSCLSQLLKCKDWFLFFALWCRKLQLFRLSANNQLAHSLTGACKRWGIKLPCRCIWFPSSLRFYGYDLITDWWPFFNCQVLLVLNSASWRRTIALLQKC